jgi:hypothetical protein
VWAGFVWFRVKSNAGILLIRKRKGISESEGNLFVAEWLVVYKAGLCSSEVVNQLNVLVYPQQLLNTVSIQSIC